MKSPVNRQTGAVQTATRPQVSDYTTDLPLQHLMSNATRLQRIARSLLFKKLAQIRSGKIVIDEGGAVHSFGDDPDDALTAYVIV